MKRRGRSETMKRRSRSEPNYVVELLAHHLDRYDRHQIMSLMSDLEYFPDNFIIAILKVLNPLYETTTSYSHLVANKITISHMPMYHQVEVPSSAAGGSLHFRIHSDTNRFSTGFLPITITFCVNHGRPPLTKNPGSAPASHGTCQTVVDISGLLIYSYCWCDRNDAATRTRFKALFHEGGVKRQSPQSSMILPEDHVLRAVINARLPVPFLLLVCFWSYLFHAVMLPYQVGDIPLMWSAAVLLFSG
ncbi:hypothetical protein Tco_1555995 [Tanacetum coccineum]